ncbi:hypothetical protein [Shewanella sp. S1-58-MNA-CIBAN-0166]|uniref:hypothetical protein n=1 Tax=Shewanella sp. S1-58-MNA-CIBAN-0166 TaxID=3140467 RepID=UPI003332E6E8
MFSLNKMPTLGYFNKVVCDSIGLWTSQDKGITFSVPAKEKQRREALKIAFSEIQKEDGSYGGLNELLSVTSRISPKQRNEIKKNKTVQAYVNYLSKEDFSSYHELVELREYIYVVIDARFSEQEVASFAKRYYELSIDYYSEFVREFTVKPAKALESYQYFIESILKQMIYVLRINCLGTIQHELGNYSKESWPLRSFADAATNLCNVSLHELNQFHEIRLSGRLSDLDIWETDFKATPVNTKSKQVIDRLSRNNRIKWDSFYSTMKPLVSLLPPAIDKEHFTLSAFTAFVTHNLNSHVSVLDISPCSEIDDSYPSLNAEDCMPVTERIDALINNFIVHEIDSSMEQYRNYKKNVMVANSFFLNNELDIPDTITFTYDIDLTDFPVEKFEGCTEWINEWIFARLALKSDNPVGALHHFKNAHELAKYSAGPLYLPFYLQVCAFCISQFKKLSISNEEDVFDRFYEPLGSEASSYAKLMGFSPRSIRDSKTLMPRSSAPLKEQLIIKKIDTLVEIIKSNH